MSILDVPPKLLNDNWPQWAQRTSLWLARTRSSLRFKVADESAAENGVLLWDEANNVVVVSRNGQYDEMLTNKATKIVFDQEAGYVGGAGELWWNKAEDTLNIGHLNDAVQQVGQETYIIVQNDTGSTITNGTSVGFAGVGTEVQASPFVANGTVPGLYFIGIATSDIANGAIGKATLLGKVRAINTTGSDVSETWLLGDILYANPTTAGKLTKVRPTAPNEVIVVAAIIKVGSTDGEILVRAQPNISLDYAEYTDSTDQSIATIDTAQAITFNTTEVEHGISLGTPTSRVVFSQSGLYQVAPSLQVTSNSASTKNTYCWIRKNGVDIPRTRIDATISGSATTLVLTSIFQVSALANDYIEIMFASGSASVRIDARPATAFAPAAPSALVEIVQLQL